MSAHRTKGVRPAARIKLQGHVFGVTNRSLEFTGVPDIMMVMGHTEIPTKVNAWVDCGIEPLVTALNQFEEIVTVDSCQGDDGRPAYVHFLAHGDDFALYESVTRMSRAIQPCSDGYTLQIEWVAGAERPLATLYARQDMIPTLAEVITKAASCDRTKVSVDDTKHTVLRNSTIHQNHQAFRRVCGGIPQNDE